MTQSHQDSAERNQGPDIAFSLSRPPSKASPSASAPDNTAVPDPEPPMTEASAAAPVDTPVAVDDSDPSADNRHTDSAVSAPIEEPSGIEDIEEQATELAFSIARELAAAGPEGWLRLEAHFAITVAGGVAHTWYYDDTDGVAKIEASPTVMELVERQREVSAGIADGPWWRMVVRLTATGDLEVDYDYGDEPFPGDQLLSSDAYSADVEAFPRERIPVWLAAYIRHNNRQVRPPQLAREQARADRKAGIAPIQATDQLPDLPTLWVRWATIAAAFVAVGSEWGPRLLPAIGVFEGAARSGATLYILPGDRAVLSGGVWNASELDAAYNDDKPLPALYSGAPEWIADPVLNPRVAQGMLSFCYWWERGSWFCGESALAEENSAAIPGIWSAQTVTDVLCGVVGEDPNDEQRTAAADLVAAVEGGVVTRDTLSALFDNPSDDIDGAMYQLSLAGLVTEDPDELF
ncbi:MAG: hypothetical protein J2P17_02680 [Mycobacterium sp.]|nr:hypothetical protein [Mycobacterium sp.]